MENDRLVLLIYSEHSPEVTGLKSRLEKDFSVHHASSDQGLRSLSKEIKPDIVLYLISKNEDLKYTSVLEVSRKINSGIFVLTSSYVLQDELHYLSSGADHYLLLSTPYEALKLRLLRLGRRIQSARDNTSLPFTKLRATGRNNDNLNYESLKINLHEEVVYQEGEPLMLPRIHVKLLIAFLSLPDELITRQWLITNVWEGEEVSPRSIDAHISKLKKAIPSLHRDVVNIYGKGYIFKSNQRAAV